MNKRNSKQMRQSGFDPVFLGIPDQEPMLAEQCPLNEQNHEHEQKDMPNQEGVSSKDESLLDNKPGNRLTTNDNDLESEKVDFFETKQPLNKLEPESDDNVFFVYGNDPKIGDTVSESAQKFESYGIPIQETKACEEQSKQEYLLPELAYDLESELGQEYSSKSVRRFKNLILPVLKTSLLGLSSLICLLVLAEAWSLFNKILFLPIWAKYPALALIALLLGIVFLSMYKIVRAYFKLRRSPRLSVSALQNLENRGNLRSQALQSWFQAQGELLDFLKGYLFEQERTIKNLNKLGFSQEEIQILHQNQSTLLNTVQESSAQEWLNRLDKEFIQTLDKVAKRRIGRYAKFVGLKTAIAPTGFVDTAIVVYNSYRLIGDLCSIYRLRAGSLETFYILLRIFVNTFVAGQLEDMLEGLVNQLMQEFGDTNHFVSFLSRAHLGGVFSRAAEGSTNAMLILRLGASTVCYLRPIRIK